MSVQIASCQPLTVDTAKHLKTQDTSETLNDSVIRSRLKVGPQTLNLIVWVRILPPDPRALSLKDRAEGREPSRRAFDPHRAHYSLVV